MSFSINETGVERGATTLVFPSPVIVLDPEEEGDEIVSDSHSIVGTVIVQRVVRDQAKTLLRLRAVDLSLAQRNTLASLMTGGAVTVKLTPGSATTLTCIFAGKDQQTFTPLTGDHPLADSSGAALDDRLTRYRVDMLLFRLD